MNSGLRRELINLVALVAFAFLLGKFTGYTLELLVAALAAYIFWYLYNLSRLISWLGRPKKQLPESLGIWDELYYQIHHLYLRQRKTRKKLKNIVDRFQRSTKALPSSFSWLGSHRRCNDTD